MRFNFEREFWEEWEKAVPAALDAMGELAKVIEAARRAVLLTQGPGSWRFGEGPGPAGWLLTRWMGSGAREHRLEELLVT